MNSSEVAIVVIIIQNFLCVYVYRVSSSVGVGGMGNEVAKGCRGYCEDEGACCEREAHAKRGVVKTLAEAEERLLHGLQVVLILQDRTRLTGKCRVNATLGTMMLTCERKVRVIAFTNIAKLLHTARELDRVEQRAGSAKHYEDHCVAVQLRESRNCIPIFFASLQDKLLFLHVVATGIGVQMKAPPRPPPSPSVGVGPAKGRSDVDAQNSAAEMKPPITGDKADRLNC
eukprot:GHVS01042906.1.p1 GENE.GHVS01042906.1~~GHVS01042906.1.p1  ORF type:complete len:229 (+),score=52.39 GHVS01042906.1:919-1605(+)